MFKLDTYGSQGVRTALMSKCGAAISTVFVQAFAVFCGLLGVLWGSIKIFGVPPELIYLAPSLALIYLAFALLSSSRRRNVPKKR